MSDGSLVKDSLVNLIYEENYISDYTEDVFMLEDFDNWKSKKLLYSVLHM